MPLTTWPLFIGCRVSGTALRRPVPNPHTPFRFCHQYLEDSSHFNISSSAILASLCFRFFWVLRGEPCSLPACCFTVVVRFSPLSIQVSMSSSSASSSSSGGACFYCFQLGEEGFRCCELDVSSPNGGESRIAVASYRNSLPKERLHSHCVRFYVPTDQELIVP